MKRGHLKILTSTLISTSTSISISISILTLISTLAFSQSSQSVEKPLDRYVFGQIFADFRYGFNDSYKPQAAFDFNQGIIGYYHEISPTVSGKIMFDVTRTTNIYEITDSAGNILNINYFEGSKYTAYLKMAEIRWDINKVVTLRFGQLLNTQYLTFIDPFWGYRYVDVTMQEKYRLGMPADFGVQVDLNTGEKLLHQFSVVNGEGPFRYQDLNSAFVYSYNVQFTPFEGLTIKAYADYGPSPDTAAVKDDKFVISGFAGYKNDKFRIGAEVDYVNNYGWNRDQDVTAFSIFGGWNFYKKLDVLARYDYLVTKMPNETTRAGYVVAGLQYEPVKMFTTSLNFRYYSLDDLPFIFLSVGLKM